MNELRLILLVLGAAAIAGIWLWESRKDRWQQRRRTVMRSTQPEDLPPVRTGVRAAGDEDYSEAIADLNRALAERNRPVPAGEDSRTAAVGPPAPRTAVAPARDLFGSAGGTEREGPEHAGTVTPDRIISLHVTAPEGSGFTGPQILDAMDTAGLRYGAMHIFHRHDGEGEGRPLFSVASMQEPGSFDLAQMQDFSTRGLSLFMCLPESGGAGREFDLMLTTAELLAGELGGEVRGPDHGRLQQDDIAALRARAAG